VKATVSAWRVSLEKRKVGSSSIIIRMSAIRKLAAEAAENGILAPELAAGATRVKSAKSVGIRMENWLPARRRRCSTRQDATTVQGLRDRAIIAVLPGCGLRQSEVAGFTFGHIQQRDGRCCIVDLVGKHGRIRTTPMPNWVKVAIDAWTSSAAITQDHVFLAVIRGDRISGERLGEKVVWQMLKNTLPKSAFRNSRLSRFTPHLREIVPRRRRRTGAGPDAARACTVQTDDGAISRHEAGSRPRA
jgi:site-specific recombinase XerC